VRARTDESTGKELEGLDMVDTACKRLLTKH
jgi:hypothetical protein